MKIGQLLIGLGITAAALTYTFWNVSFADLFDSFKTVKYVYLIPAAFLMAFSYLARAWRWKELLSPIKAIPARELYSPLMVGFMGNILPARAGEFVRAYLLGKKHHLTFSSAFASIVVERLFDIIVLLLLFVWVFIFHAEVFQSDVMISGVPLHTLVAGFGKFSAAIVVFLLIFIYLMIAHKAPLTRIIQRVIRPLPKKWHDKVEYLVEEFSQGLLVARHPTALLKASLYSLLVWAAIVLSYYPFYWAFDLVDKSPASLLILVVFVCVLITVAPTPGFLGSFNAGVLIALHTVMGEEELTAVSFGMVCWGVNFLVLLVGGVYFIFHDHYSVRTLIEVEEKDLAALDEDI